MTRFVRSLPLWLVLALACSTGCAAVGHSVGAESSDVGDRASDSPHAIEDPQSVPQATSVQGDSAAVTKPAGGDRNSTLVVILCLAAVAGLMFLVAR